MTPNSPYTAPPRALQAVLVQIDGPGGMLSTAPAVEVRAYRVDYRIRAVYQDFNDPETGIAWRFCRRITGQDHIPAETVRGWLPIPEEDTHS